MSNASQFNRRGRHARADKDKPASYSSDPYPEATITRTIEPAFQTNNPYSSISRPAPELTSQGPRVSNSTATSSTTAPSATGTASTGAIAYHQFYRQDQQVLNESNNQASWGNWYYVTDNVVGLTHQSGSDVDVRGQFGTAGVLDNSQDTNFRAINDAYPVFSFAVDLGSVGSTPVDSLFTIVLAQNQSIEFEGSMGNVTVPSLWTSYYGDELDLVGYIG